MLTMDWGESAAGEVDRLLDRYAGPDAIVLDIGCGAGQTLCRLAPRVRAIYGFDQEEDLLTAARERAASLGITNATFLLGNVSNPEDADALPDRMITLAFSRRGPNLPGAFLPRLTPDAVLVQELVGDQDGAGLKELLGRRPFVPRSQGDADPLIGFYGGLEMLPVSAKSYWSEQYFRRTEDGIRVLRHRRVYVFRRARVNYYPADPLHAMQFRPPPPPQVREPEPSATIVSSDPD